jgi:hypothetical protein
MSKFFDKAKFDKIKAEVSAEISLDIWIITEERDGEPVKAHYVTIPGPSEPGRYIAQVSLSAFQTRELSRWEPVWRSGNTLPFNYCHHDRLYSKVIDSRYYGEDYDPGVPVVNHDSIWEFYRVIGYDHKKNKFVAISNKGGKLAP